MANDIYITTLGGLSELVSPRVAEGVLKRSLAAVSVEPDEVDARTMSRLLRGRIRRDLERTLPRGGLRKSLADLDARIQELPAPTAAVEEGRPREPSAVVPAPRAVPGVALPPSGREPVVWRHEPRDDSDLPVRTRAFPVAGDPPPKIDGASPTRAGPGAPVAAPNGWASRPGGAPLVLRPPPADRPAAGPRPAAEAATASGPALAGPGTPLPAPAPGGATRERPREVPVRVRPVPDAAVARVAEGDGVRQWVWATPAPEVHGRGEGPEPSRVDGEVRAIIALLSKHGRLSSMHVRHGTGQVLFGVTGPSALVVAGDEGINIGAIYATFRALEEEP